MLLLLLSDNVFLTLTQWLDDWSSWYSYRGAAAATTVPGNGGLSTLGVQVVLITSVLSNKKFSRNCACYVHPKLMIDGLYVCEEQKG